MLWSSRRPVEIYPNWPKFDSHRICAGKPQSRMFQEFSTAVNKIEWLFKKKKYLINYWFDSQRIWSRNPQNRMFQEFSTTIAKIEWLLLKKNHLIN